MKTFNKIFTILVFLFLYIPMIVLAVASFNSGTDIAVWKGFTFAQYGELFRDGVLLPLLLRKPPRRLRLRRQRLRLRERPIRASNDKSPQTAGCLLWGYFYAVGSFFRC